MRLGDLIALLEEHQGRHGDGVPVRVATGLGEFSRPCLGVEWRGDSWGDGAHVVIVPDVPDNSEGGLMP